MSPRRYRQVTRASHAGATRSSIVTAAIRLHAERGALATSWDDLAAAAGVNRATVYRQFPNLDALIPACARVAFEAIDLPEREELEAGFAGLGTDDRLRKVIFETCECYERGGPRLRAARREGDLVPAFAEVNRRLTEGGAALVDVACARERLDAETRRLVQVLIDFPFWQQLLDSGVSAGRAPQVIHALVKSVLAGREEAR